MSWYRRSWKRRACVTVLDPTWRQSGLCLQCWQSGINRAPGAHADFTLFCVASLLHYTSTAPHSVVKKMYLILIYFGTMGTVCYRNRA